MKKLICNFGLLDIVCMITVFMLCRWLLNKKIRIQTDAVLTEAPAASTCRPERLWWAAVRRVRAPHLSFSMWVLSVELRPTWAHRCGNGFPWSRWSSSPLRADWCPWSASSCPLLSATACRSTRRKTHAVVFASQITTSWLSSQIKF